MENLFLTLQHNEEVPPNHQKGGASEGENDSHILTKKDINDILAKAKEEDMLKENGIKPPYPLWMDSITFPTKFKQPGLQTSLSSQVP